MSFARLAQHWLPVLPLLALLGATYWLNLQVLPESAKPDNGTPHDPDSIVENFSATRLNAQGTPHFILSARKMLHYPDDDSTVLEVPRLSLLSRDRPSLVASAKTGTLASKGDELFLRGDVEVLHGIGTGQQPLKLQTEYLHIIPALEEASSNLAVTLIETNATIKAVGIELNNKTRSIKLLSQVSGIYAPADRSNSGRSNSDE